MASGEPGDGMRVPHAQLVQSLGVGMAGRLLPLLMESVLAEKDDLNRCLHGQAPPPDAPDDIANLNIIASQITAYERRWRSRFDRSVRSWPEPPGPVAYDAFGLVSDEELQAQLIGQPVIEALERRHGDILDTIDKRLWSLAAAMGGRIRPENPFSPRHIVESFLQTFDEAHCGQRLRGALLRHYELLVGQRLVEAYAWCNRRLAEAGLALASTSDYATLAATAVSARYAAPDVAKLDVWGADNALAPAAASWRLAGADARSTRGDAIRGDVLRHAARVRRDAAGAERRLRELRTGEFLAVLSLLQGEPVPLRDAGRGHARAMRDGLNRVAVNLGIDCSRAAPSPVQEDALDVIGALFDHLASHYHLSDRAREQLAMLALPYLRLALSEPRLFDPPPPPAMQVLSQLVGLWDGNCGTRPADGSLHELADAVAREVVAEYHGDELVFERALRRLEEALEPLRRRAAISERRAWQMIEGGERLEAARRAADRELGLRLEGTPMLPAVATFLREQWRQWLVQAWLRAGPQSDRYAGAIALGDAIVRLDEDAARAKGASVAARLLTLQPELHSCCAACGLDEQGAAAVLAGLVTELANPDAPRALHDFTPLSNVPGSTAASHAQGADDLEPGRVLLLVESGRAPRTLRLAWRSALTGNSLLVNRQGVRELLLAAGELAVMLDEGRLRARPPEDPVEAALRHMDAASPGLIRARMCGDGNGGPG